MPFLPIEVSQRIQTAHPGGRQVMLHYLLPWMNNVELVDFKPVARRPDDCGSGEEDEESHEREIMMVNSRRWLRGEGWGSPKATTMVLNNLMFMTAKVKPHTHFPVILCHTTNRVFLQPFQSFFVSMGMSLHGQRSRMCGPLWPTAGQRTSKSSCTSSSVCQESAVTPASCPM